MRKFLRSIFKSAAGAPARVVIIFEDRIEWHSHGKLHRVDGPAIEWADGAKEWYLNGKRHRTNGPAIQRNCGCSAWYENGVLIKAEGEDRAQIYSSGGRGIKPTNRRCKFN